MASDALLLELFNELVHVDDIVCDFEVLAVLPLP